MNITQNRGKITQHTSSETTAEPKNTLLLLLYDGPSLSRHPTEAPLPNHTGQIHLYQCEW